MGVRAFFRKEWYGSRRNLIVLFVLLVALPGGAAFGTAAFQQTIPEDIPVGIAPQDESVTDDELTVIQGGVALYASPERYSSTEEARAALEREEVYLVIEVPHGLFDEGANASVNLVSDQRVVSFREPATYTEETMAPRMDERLPANVEVEHERIGTRYTLSEYLVPTALVTTVLAFAFAYLPLEFRRERRVFERVELESRVEAAVAAKLAFYGVLMIVPVAVFQLVGLYLGYRVNHFDPHTLGILALTYLYAVAISTGVMFATRLRRTGLFVNLGVLGGMLALSSMVYPAGFFSRIEKEIALALPSHYTIVIARSTMLKDLPLAAFTRALAYLAAVTVLAIAFLQLSITYYRRSS